jgi:hypothetical protein
MLTRTTFFGLALLLTTLTGCVGPGLEPPQPSAQGPKRAQDGGAGEPVGVSGGTGGGNAGTGSASGAPQDAGTENGDAASDSSLDDDAGT